MCSFSTLVDIGTLEAVSFVSFIASAAVRTFRVAASGVLTAWRLGTLILVVTIDPIANVPGDAGTLEGAGIVSARGEFFVTVVGLPLALVDVVAGDAVVLRLPATVASASVRTRQVVALGVDITRTHLGGTLVDIDACLAVTRVTGIASAGVGPDVVLAAGLFGTRRGITLVFVLTLNARTKEAFVASAVEAAVVVSAAGIDVTVVGSVGALVDVLAVDSVTFETCIAAAFKGARNVVTRGLSMTVICSVDTFVVVSAGLAVSREAGVAFTCVEPALFLASGVQITRVLITFIDIGAPGTRTLVSGVASAGVTAMGVVTGGIGVAIIFEFTLVDVLTTEAISGEATSQAQSKVPFKLMQ